ncbi:hypothetical protein Syun_031358 [Stephania yunnanensis]|uniref:Uncharacterized protein n=1 Tax=Stephania yunnanensis TaxID=152371 RepID=A0AAP0DZQ0_9MAGN
MLKAMKKLVQKLDENQGNSADMHPEEELVEAEASELLLVCDVVANADRSTRLVEIACMTCLERDGGMRDNDDIQPEDAQNPADVGHTDIPLALNRNVRVVKRTR